LVVVEGFFRGRKMEGFEECGIFGRRGIIRGTGGGSGVFFSR
jgi:hypothetical protein